MSWVELSCGHPTPAWSKEGHVILNRHWYKCCYVWYLLEDIHITNSFKTMIQHFLFLFLNKNPPRICEKPKVYSFIYLFIHNQSHPKCGQYFTTVNFSHSLARWLPSLFTYLMPLQIYTISLNKYVKSLPKLLQF